LPVGRNVEEFVRLVQAFQYADKHGEVCPAKWRPGSKTMKPDPHADLTKTYWEEEHVKHK
jgi:alkyl hydroperoxide reductase subunit AhpC